MDLGPHNGKKLTELVKTLFTSPAVWRIMANLFLDT